MGRKEGRTYNVSQNAIWAIIYQCINIILAFGVRKVFIDYIGIELSGVDSLYKDILAICSFADLGIGTAITFALYKPIAENNKERVLSLLHFFQKVYNYVAVLLALITYISMYWLKTVNSTIPLEKLQLYFVLYQARNIVEYFFAYRETYVTAIQKNRVISKLNTLCTLIRYLLLFIFIIVTRDYVVYLSIDLCVAIFRKFLVNIYLKREYPEILLCKVEKLSSKERMDLMLSSKAVLIHRSGNLAINQTDSIIVSSFLSVTYWGIISNYLLLKKTAQVVGDTIYSSILPSFGNLLATSTKQHQIEVFEKYVFINFIFYSFCFVCLGNVSTDFIRIVFGNQYVVPEPDIFVMLLAFYIDGLRAPVSVLREASGNFIRDRWYTVIAAIANIIASILLVEKYKVIGVYAGTIIAMILLHLFRTLALFEKDYHYSSIKYLIKVFSFIIIGIVQYFISFLLLKNICIAGLYGWIQIIIKILFVFVFFSITILLLFYKKIISLVKKQRG